MSPDHKEEGRPAAIFMNSKRLGDFTFSPDHPFKPERVSRVYEMCRRRGLFDMPHIRVVEVEEAEDGVIESFHSPEYARNLKQAGETGETTVEMLYHGLGTMENPVFRGLYDFSAISATASLRAARMVAEGAGAAFNPCGGFHHAHRDRASGFCYVNDIVIAINELRRMGVRTAYVDIDAHHGDGVQEAFYADPGVLTISVHESGKTLFPWGGFERETGEGPGKGYNINIPIEADSDDEIFLLLFKEIVMDALGVFRPDIVVGQFGTDTFATDPLTHLRMTNNGYIEAVSTLHSAFPRIVALGGGGYNMGDVVRGWTLLWAELAGVELDTGYGGALGGVLMGDASIDGSDLRDMQIVTSGPAKERLKEKAGELIGWYRGSIRPFIAR